MNLRLRTARLGGVAASVVLLAVTVIVVGSETPGYSQWADTVSHLASPGQPHARVTQACIVLYGLLIIAGSRPLGGRVPGRDRLLARLVALYGVAAVVAGVAPKDAPAVRRSLMSAIHVDATIAGGICIVAAMVVVASAAPELSARRLSAAVAKDLEPAVSERG